MGLFKNFSFAFGAVGRSLALLADYPKFIFPLFMSVLLKMIVAYHAYFYYIDNIEPASIELFIWQDVALFAMAILFIISVIEAVMASIVLELVEHLKDKNEPSIFKAAWDSMSFNFIRMFPLIAMWFVARIVFAVLDAVLGLLPSSDRDERRRLLKGGMSGVLNATMDTVKFSFMMMYPAIAWDGRGSLGAFLMGGRYMRSEFGNLVAGKLVLDLFGFVVFLPLGVFVWAYAADVIGDVGQIEWVAIVLYTFVMQSLYEFVEILFTAELYTWAGYYDDAQELAQKKKLRNPDIRSVKRPNIIGIVRRM